jgi:hypothetical protein
MKYLVIADLSKIAYSINNFLFGIFDTKEEAIQWIVNNPSHETSDGDFNFFEFYEGNKIINIYEEIGEHGSLRPRRTKVGERIMSKEEYAEMYIREFDGSPLSIGWCEG